MRPTRPGSLAMAIETMSPMKKKGTMSRATKPAKFASWLHPPLT